MNRSAATLLVLAGATTALVLAGLALVAPCARASDLPPPLVSHWAPVIYHDVTGDYRDDYLTRFDFDGDWEAWNNHAHLDSGAHPLPGAVYYAVIETETHWYVTYALFHPYDASLFAAKTREAPLCLLHENDMEGATLTLRKDGSPHGEFRAMATEAHGDVHYFKPTGSDVTIGPDHRDPATGGGGPDSVAYFPTVAPGPALFVEADGHAVGSQYRALVPDPGGDLVLGGGEYSFKGDDGIVYYHDGGPAEEPSGTAGEWVRYELRPLEELWSRRHNPPGEAPYCDFEDFAGTRGCALDSLAVSFGGSCAPFGQCAANPPWGWDTDAPGAPRGEWFLDPAYAAGFLHLEDLPERLAAGFGDYVSNPYLAGDTFVRVDAPDAATTWTVDDPVVVAWTQDDTGHGPALGSTVDVELSRGGAAWETIATGVPIGDGGLGWTVTGPAADSCRVRVRAGTDCILTVTGTSDVFRIEAAQIGIPGERPSAAVLLTAAPNPFSGSTSIFFEAPERGSVRLAVYDIAGRPVRTLAAGRWYVAGPQRLTWDGRDDAGRVAAPGAYVLRLEAGGRVVTRKVARLR